MTGTMQIDLILPVQRKRPYRTSMGSNSPERSSEEINEILDKYILGDSTRNILLVMAQGYQALKTLPRNSEQQARKQAELLRTETLVSPILAQDHKYQQISSQLQATLDHSRILNFGDYHKGNLGQFRSIAKELVKQRNKGKKMEDKCINLLDRPWRDILKDLEKEESQLKIWKANNPRFAPSHHPLPSQEVTQFVMDVGQSCTPRIWDLKQAVFEMSEYQRRNQIAHTGIDEMVDIAKKTKDKSSEHWKTVAQLILADQQALEDNRIPIHLLEGSRREQMVESLLIFQSRFFKKLTSKLDSQGVRMPNELEMSDIFFPELDEDEEKDDTISIRVKNFMPKDKWEITAKDEFLAAEVVLAQCESDFQTAQSTVTDAEKERKEALGALRDAQKQLAKAKTHFRDIEKSRAKYSRSR